MTTTVLKEKDPLVYRRGSKSFFLQPAVKFLLSKADHSSSNAVAANAALWPWNDL